MPKTTTAKGSRASKAPKTPREPNPQRLYRSLFDQLEAGFSANALKTVDKRAPRILPHVYKQS